MAVTKTGELYGCSVCGNEIIVTKVGGGTLVCCGHEMAIVDADSEEVIIEEEGSEDEE